MKLLIDMNLGPDWRRYLTDAGFEAVHWSTLGEVTATDSEIMDYASAAGYVLLTHDLDFGALLAGRSARGPSVIQVRSQDVLPDSIGPAVVAALAAARQQLVTGALVTVEPSRHRIRLLPI